MIKTYQDFLYEKQTMGISYDALPESIRKAAIDSKKDKELQSFFNALPEGEGKNEMFDLLNSISRDSGATKDFISKLWTKKGPSRDGSIDVSKSDYESGLGAKIFDLKPAGMGRGELFLAWLVKDSQTQGGSVNFDLKTPQGTFEVKDYRDKKNSYKPIRLGSKGKAPRFTFTQQIYETLSLLKKMKGDGSKYNFEKSIGDPEFIKVVNDMTARESMILSGEFNRTDYDNFLKFYEKVSSITFTPDVYVKAILRGPGGEPMEFNIEPISIADANKSNVITLKKASGDISTADSVLSELRRLKYARNPKDLLADIQSAVNEIVGDIPFVVFRNFGINVTKDFSFYQISQSGVIIVERSIADKEKDKICVEDAEEID
jgi:hypothetical protein